jgi:hypothetical protein
MFYAFLLVVGVAGIGIYVTLIFLLVPGAAEDRLGVLEELPPDIGVWKTDDSSPAGMAAAAQGLSRQVRILHQPTAGLLGAERLVRQVRCRDRTTNEIVHVEPDEVLKRRRVKR